MQRMAKQESGVTKVVEQAWRQGDTELAVYLERGLLRVRELLAKASHAASAVRGAEAPAESWGGARATGVVTHRLAQLCREEAGAEEHDRNEPWAGGGPSGVR